MSHKDTTSIYIYIYPRLVSWGRRTTVSHKDTTSIYIYMPKVGQLGAENNCVS